MENTQSFLAFYIYGNYPKFSGNFDNNEMFASFCPEYCDWLHRLCYTSIYQFYLTSFTSCLQSINQSISQSSLIPCLHNQSHSDRYDRHGTLSARSDQFCIFWGDFVRGGLKKIKTLAE